LALLTGAAAACRPIDLVVVPKDSGSAGAGGSAGASGADAGPMAGVSGGADGGPIADAGTDASPIDAGVICLDDVPEGLRAGDLPAALATRAPAFPNAVCSCRGLLGRDALVTDVWGGGAGGDVALNDEQVNLQADSAIGGSLIAAGAIGMTLTADIELSVGGNLTLNGPLQGAASAVNVGGNAAVGDDIDLMDLRVSGTLTQPQGAGLAVSGTTEIGAQQSGEVMVGAPCPCGPGELVDVAGIASAALPSTEPALPQSCPWRAGGPPRALFIAGDLSLPGDLVIGTGPGENLALIVEGNVLVEGRVELGSAEHHRRVDLYVGGTGTVQFTSGGTLVGALYAPNSELLFRQPLTVYGALFAERVSGESRLTVHHDPALR
jgi:cytoskeletal protein CcmA (bactofilin family)